MALTGCRPETAGTSNASPSVPPASVTAAAPTLRFAVDPEASLVTVRVREQLVVLPAMSDAVLTTSAISGEIGLTRDGRITSETQMSVELGTLMSDEPRRDSYVKQDTLQVQSFPTAEVRVTGTSGLPQPLPASGEWKFTLLTTMTVHGTAHEVSWDVTAQRVLREIRATARTTVHFGDFGLERPTVAAVLSVQDEIRLEVLLRAVQR